MPAMNYFLIYIIAKCIKMIADYNILQILHINQT